MSSDISRRDGGGDFSGGINSIAVTTLSSERYPGGLKRNELAWIINGTCRDGGITVRAGWIRIAKIFGSEGLFQGKWIYRPVGAFPYEIWSVSGNILKVDLDTGSVRNLSQEFNLYNNPTEPFAYYVQAEEFALIQSGDNVTLPLIWDGNILRRSNGITGNVGQPSQLVRHFDATAFWKVPSVGATVTIPIAALYPGVLLEQGVLRYAVGSFDIGTFTVTAFTLVAPFTLTIRTDASNHIGENFAPSTVVAGGYQFTLTAVPSPVLINEIPAATTMVYYMSRLWYAQGRIFTAGDIVFGPSGTAAYGFRDSVLKVTENPLAVGGDGFIVPSLDGEIRALQYGANIDAALGQGRLFIFTIKAVYALQVPTNRDDWIAAGANNEPLMTVVQLANGSVNDRSVTPANGDLFYQSLEPGIRSLQQSVRYFQQWANVSISSNENRILQFNDRSLMRGASGIFFNNRILQSVLPRQTPQGVVHDQIVPFDTLPVSTFNQQRPSNWEGSYIGVPIFQMQVADFGGRERAFAAVLASDGALELWEMTFSNRYDYAEELSEDARRIVMKIEFPAFTWSEVGWEEELKRLTGCDIWIDRMWGTVEFKLEYKPDGSNCSFLWHEWNECFPRDNKETVGSLPTGYAVAYGECFKRMTLMKPPENCGPCGSKRPAYEGHQFQPILTIKGFCRVRGIWMWGQKIEQGQYPLQQTVC